MCEQSLECSEIYSGAVGFSHECCFSILINEQRLQMPLKISFFIPLPCLISFSEQISPLSVKSCSSVCMGTLLMNWRKALLIIISYYVSGSTQCASLIELSSQAVISTAAFISPKDIAHSFVVRHGIVLFGYFQGILYAAWPLSGGAGRTSIWETSDAPVVNTEYRKYSCFLNGCLARTHINEAVRSQTTVCGVWGGGECPLPLNCCFSSSQCV